jgi:hypothetical protein
MKAILLTGILALSLVGCKPTESDANSPASPAANAPAPSAQAGTGAGVAPMASGAAGGMTPMSGTDSVQGAGGGSTSMAAKGWAKNKVNNLPSSSAGQELAEEGN